MRWTCWIQCEGVEEEKADFDCSSSSSGSSAEAEVEPQSAVAWTIVDAADSLDINKDRLPELFRFQIINGEVLNVEISQPAARPGGRR